MTGSIRAAQEIVAVQREIEGAARSIKPEYTAWTAMQQATSLGLDARQVTAAIAETVLRTVWDNARAMYDGADITHDHNLAEDNGGCNACILADIAAMLGRKHWASEINANVAATA